MVDNKQIDQDPAETEEWLEALDSVIEFEGVERAQFLIDNLLQHASQKAVKTTTFETAYINSIPVEDQEPYPGNLELADKVRAIIRWNAIAMVLRAGKKNADLGGHIASYASAALLYDIGFDHFFRARSEDHAGDLIYIQGHSSP